MLALPAPASAGLALVTIAIDAEAPGGLLGSEVIVFKGTEPLLDDFAAYFAWLLAVRFVLMANIRFRKKVILAERCANESQPGYGRYCAFKDA